MNRIRRLLIILNNTRIRRLLAVKIKKIKKGLRAKDSGSWKEGAELRERHLQLWKGYRKSINLDWLDVYTVVSGRQDHRYVPEDIYYTEIEPRLNNKVFSKAWTDKNSYDLFLGGRVKMPEVVLRCINGVLYTPDFRPAGRPGEYRAFPPAYEGRKLIIKPTMDSGGGKAVRVISCSGEGVELNPRVQGVTTLPQLFGLYGGNFIIQKYIDQHPWFARFNESSLNTVRVLTYRSIRNEEPVVLHRLLRAGRPGSVVDNQASGGIACAINADGRLMSFGVDKAGGRHKGTASIDFSEAGVVPFMEEITAASLEVASCYRYSRLLGLDFAVSDGGEVILIEVNDSNNEINFFQMSSGPLFGSFTEEVASSCRNLPRSFVIDYII
ncbi:MAG: hypothetical protein IH591_14415 [Bacteroidales bacterium]|nr:hypothetical protein [Bacteroidales bacterium]